MNDRLFFNQVNIFQDLASMRFWCLQALWESEKNDQKSIVDECASHMTLFVQALSLELAGESRYNLSYLYIVSQKLDNSDANFSI